MTASWIDDHHDSDQQRYWAKYEKPDADTVEETALRAQVEDERLYSLAHVPKRPHA